MKMTHCPHCGRRIITNKSRAFTFESSANSRLKNAAAVLPPPPMIERQNTKFLPSMEANVHVPANQAIITGCLFAPVVGLAVFSMARIVSETATGEAILIGVIAGGIALFGSATYKWHTKTAFYDSLLQQIETELGIDLDGDGEIGEPTVIKVEVKSEDGNRWQFADLPGKPEALRDFAGRVLMRQGFTDETGAMAGLTQREVKDLREIFVGRGWARWNHPTRKQQGIELTQVGKSVLRAIAAVPSPALSPTEA